jgi:hypothetical protein
MCKTKGFVAVEPDNLDGGYLMAKLTEGVVSDDVTNPAHGLHIASLLLCSYVCAGSLFSMPPAANTLACVQPCYVEAPLAALLPVPNLTSSLASPCCNACPLLVVCQPHNLLCTCTP